MLFLIMGSGLVLFHVVKWLICLKISGNLDKVALDSLKSPVFVMSVFGLQGNQVM